mmetsp:Transcript_13863/g.29579  ORF Transcript_13863/g.29579 Transcript_13863/m.29579 type:complete len:152 (-) Transcript_13863:733-1188(-)
MVGAVGDVVAILETQAGDEARGILETVADETVFGEGKCQVVEVHNKLECGKVDEHLDDVVRPHDQNERRRDGEASLDQTQHVGEPETESDGKRSTGGPTGGDVGPLVRDPLLDARELRGSGEGGERSTADGDPSAGGDVDVGRFLGARSVR